VEEHQDPVVIGTHVEIVVHPKPRNPQYFLEHHLLVATTKLFVEDSPHILQINLTLIKIP